MNRISVNDVDCWLASSDMEVFDVSSFGDVKPSVVPGATTLTVDAPGLAFLPGSRLVVRYLGREAVGWLTHLSPHHFSLGFNKFGDQLSITLATDWVEPST